MFGNERISPELLLLAGSSLAGGQTVGQQLGGIGTNVAPLLAQQAEQRKQMEAQNKTLQYLKQTNPQLAAQVEAGMPVSEAWQQVVQAQQPKKRNIISAGDGMFYDVDNGKYITPPADMVRPDNVKRGLNPIWGLDANGKRVLGTLGEDGSFKPVDLPQGFEPTPGTSTVDLGTSIGIRDNKSGTIINTLPKDVSGVEQQKAEGTVVGATKAALPAIRSTATTIKNMIADVKNDDYRGRGTGLTSVFNNVPATGGYDFQRKVDQLKGQSFLQAIQQMQGFGALSNQEGQTATAAISRLDTAQSEEAFDKALADLEQIIDRGVAKAEQMAGQQPTAAQPDNSVVPYTDFFK